MGFDGPLAIIEAMRLGAEKFGSGLPGNMLPNSPEYALKLLMKNGSPMFEFGSGSIMASAA